MSNEKSVVAVFDVGKTNKKILLFDDNYELVYEYATEFDETIDDDGDPCEDLGKLQRWIRDSLSFVTTSYDFHVKAINVTAYGASLVHLNEEAAPITPLYNYLKPFPDQVVEQLYAQYGGAERFALATNSPALKSLNSGLQLYRLKSMRPAVFSRIKTSLHLPQYLSFLVGGPMSSDITSIGCHTALWDFTSNDYHSWVYREGIFPKLAPLRRSGEASFVKASSKRIAIGVGLHDSSAALVPYLLSFRKPFVLISTGTWSISLNPFNSAPLTSEELSADCLTYFNHEGDPVKASRLFLGNFHNDGVDRLAEYFLVSKDFFKRIKYNAEIIKQIRLTIINDRGRGQFEIPPFSQRDLSQYKTVEVAYHAFMIELVERQVQSTNLIIDKGPAISTIFVDGGFGHNDVFMNLLSERYQGKDVYAATLPQATALGAALCMHDHWNKYPLRRELVELKHYEYI